MNDLYGKLSESHPDLKRGLVRCSKCGREKQVDSAACLRSGWPECCGYTMTLVTDHADKTVKELRP